MADPVTPAPPAPAPAAGPAPTAQAPAAAPANPAAPPAPAKGPPLKRASEIAAELAAEAAKAAPVAAEAKPAEPAAAKPEDKPAEPAKPPEDARLLRLARKQREHDAAVAKWKTEQAAVIGKAEKWDALDAAKTKGDQLAVLRQMFDDETISTTLYQALTEHVYSQTPRQISATDVEKMVAKRLEDERKAAAANAEKTATEKAAHNESVQRGYLGLVAEALSAEKYPHVDAYGVPGKEVLAYSEVFYNEHGRAPDGDEVLTHFEAEYAKRRPGQKPPETKQDAPGEAKPAGGATVRPGWSNDAGTANGARRMSLPESLEAAKREAGLTPR